MFKVKVTLCDAVQFFLTRDFDTEEQAVTECMLLKDINPRVISSEVYEITYSLRKVITYNS